DGDNHEKSDQAGQALRTTRTTRPPTAAGCQTVPHPCSLPLTVTLIRERLTAPHALRSTGFSPEMFARVSSISDATRQPRENAPIPSHHSGKSWASCPRECHPAWVICPEGPARAQDRDDGSSRAEGKNVPLTPRPGGMDG